MIHKNGPLRCRRMECPLAIITPCYYLGLDTCPNIAMLLDRARITGQSPRSWHTYRAQVSSHLMKQTNEAFHDIPSYLLELKMAYVNHDARKVSLSYPKERASGKREGFIYSSLFRQSTFSKRLIICHKTHSKVTSISSFVLFFTTQITKSFASEIMLIWIFDFRHFCP